MRQELQNNYIQAHIEHITYNKYGKTGDSNYEEIAPEL